MDRSQPHNHKDNRPLCSAWVEGKCFSSFGFGSCWARHYYMDRDIVVSSGSSLGSGQSVEGVTFTSPLTLRVTEEVSRTRKVQVDLETGRSKSFYEETTFEVLDLTGATPSGRGSQRTPLGSLKNQPSSGRPARLSPGIQDQSVVCLTSPSSSTPVFSLAAPRSGQRPADLISGDGRNTVFGRALERARSIARDTDASESRIRAPVRPEGRERPATTSRRPVLRSPLLR